MDDPEGDPTFRTIDLHSIEEDYVIPHDDDHHRDADKGLNVIFPATRLKEMVDDGIVGCVAERHFHFMGHAAGSHIKAFVENSALDVANWLKDKRLSSLQPPTLHGKFVKR